MIRDNDGSGPSILPLIGGLAVLGGLSFEDLVSWYLNKVEETKRKKDLSKRLKKSLLNLPTPEMYPVEGEPNLVDVEIKEALSIENGMMK